MLHRRIRSAHELRKRIHERVVLHAQHRGDRLNSAGAPPKALVKAGARFAQIHFLKDPQVLHQQRVVRDGLHEIRYFRA